METEAIWREFHQRLRAFISRRVRRSADVEDILQEVFIRIHRSVDSVQNAERLSAWIFQLTRNAIVDHFRIGKGQSEAVREDVDTVAPTDSAGEERQALKELSECIQPMVAGLPTIYREAIELTDLNGLTQIEAAQRSGLSFSGMKSRVQRARRELKGMLLKCCHVELDRRGRLADYSIRNVQRSSCGCCARDGCDR
jgi:RNA polymerase sigma-70 factor (ECF subfamily)